MSIRSLTSFSLMSVLAFGLAACSDDGKPMLTTATTAPQTTNTSNPNNTSTTDGTDSDSTDGTDGTASGSETSDTAPTTTEEPVTTTASPSTSTTTEPATTSEGTATTTTEPGTTTDTTTGGSDGLYGPCGAMGECPDGSQCVSLMGIDGNFCSPACDGTMCPATGTAAQGQCVLILEMAMDPTNCAAVCQLDAPDCPAGTTCKDIMQMGLGICTAP